MSSIDPAARLAALMNAQIAVMRERSRPASAPPKDASVRQRARDTKDAVGIALLRAKEIGPDDPQRARKAFRYFLEASLLAELGADLANDPAFATMVDDVHRNMEEDAELAPALAEAARRLLASA